MHRRSVYDLAVSLDWEYDWDFVRLIEASARAYGLTTYIVHPGNLDDALAEWDAGKIDFRVLFDRAAATSPEFVPLQNRMLGCGREVIDPLNRLRWASDKATMHLEFITRGVRTPHTVILPDHRSVPEIEIGPEEMAPLREPFFIKPANTTGGSIGVIRGARTLDDVRTARRTYPDDKYLIQECIEPEERDGKRFWFRGYHVLGRFLAAWWNDVTLLYAELTPDDIETYDLMPLFAVVEKIAGICRVGFFSTEIARNAEGRYVAVDYVNESCDMRLQSVHPDGVPDAVVRAVAGRIVEHVRDMERERRRS